MTHSQEMTNEEMLRLLNELSKAFSPAAPVNTRDLFAGRLNEISRILNTINSRGLHAIIFGERGVGKTSLANFAKLFLANDQGIVSMTNCNEGDTFESIWDRIFSGIVINRQYTPAGFTAEQLQIPASAIGLVKKPIDPGSVQGALSALSESYHITIIIDEFDRIKDDDQKCRFADTIKWLSDISCNVTIVLVGVAHNVEHLIMNHNSVERALVQIKMPRMNNLELAEIIDKALRLQNVSMTIDPQAKDLIIYLSQGLPHYTHLIGRDSAIASVKRRSRHIADIDVVGGIKSALQDKHESLGRAYQNAISSQRKDALFKHVLLACAVAEADELGYFATTDIRGPLNKITNKEYEIPNYSGHLVKFSNDESRGSVLERKGPTRRYRFRFRNPLLQPYVIMKGIDDGLIDKTLLESLLGIQPVPAREAQLFPT